MLVELIGGSDKGKQMIAVDIIGAGIGENVVVVQGSSARRMLEDDDAPVDAAIIGIIDKDCVIKE
jgi:ethanolamine utilization protein EutN